ncbi:methionine sulfoxide reductase, partial [Vibrio parahaemolyticus]
MSTRIKFITHGVLVRKYVLQLLREASFLLKKSMPKIVKKEP